jgi:hypothetical protein
MSQVPDDMLDPPVDAPRAEPGPIPPRTPASDAKEPRDSDEKQTPRPGIIEAVADLLQYIVDWLRQEVTTIVHDKVVLPLQKLGLTLASGCAAAFLAALGIGFIAVGVFILLGQWLTYPGALLLIGGVLVLGAIVFTVIKMRSIQR